ARASLSIREGLPGTLIWDARVRNGHWIFDGQNQLKADFLHFYSQGSWTAYRQIYDQEQLVAPTEAIDIQVRATNLSGDAQELLANKLQFGHVSYHGNVARGADRRLSVQASKLELDNPDFHLSAHGTWKQGPE